MKNIAVIICAAGSSVRFGSTKKEYLPLGLFSHFTASSNQLSEGVSVLSECVYKFLSYELITSVTLVVKPGDEAKAIEVLKKDSRVLWSNASNGFKQIILGKKLFIVPGGNTRQKSVYLGLEFLASLNEHIEQVLVHDGARPFFSSELLKTIIEKLFTQKAVVPGIAVVDTQKKVNPQGIIVESLKRSELKAVQTPQGFDFTLLYKAHQKANECKDDSCTDDSELVAKYGEKCEILVVEGEIENKKITYPSDKIKDFSPQIKDITKLETKNPLPEINQKLKVGFGYDLHQLKKGLPLLIGGVKLESELGCLAHSDGDVLLHAITDALLGAVGISDIGELFPPSDNTWKGASSLELLKKAWTKCKSTGNYIIQNIDCVVVLERPKLLPYREQIRQTIACCLDIDPSDVFVKAKTKEKVDAVGKGKAIEAFATVLLIHTYQTSLK